MNWTDADRTTAALDQMKRISTARTKANIIMNGERTWTAEQHNEAVRMRQDGLSFAKIGRKIGKSRAAVAGRLWRVSGFIKDAKKAGAQAFDGIPDTPEPLSLHTPTRASHCQYPIGNPKKLDFHFCGQPKAQGSYCQEHYDLCHNTTAPRLGWR